MDSAMDENWFKQFCFVWQEKEYKDALDAFNEKNNEKVQLISKLMEVSLVNWLSPFSHLEKNVNQLYNLEALINLK